MVNYLSPALFQLSSDPSYFTTMSGNNNIFLFLLLLTLTNSFVGVGSAGYGDHCASYKDCADTRFCSKGKCACPHGENDQVYENEIGACLSLIGAKCQRAMPPGFTSIVFKCVENAQCVLGGNTEHSKYYGVCSCKSGFVPSETYPFSCVQKGVLARARQSPQGGSSESSEISDGGRNSVRAPPYPGASHRSWTQSSSASKFVMSSSLSFLQLAIALVVSLVCGFL